RLRIGAVVLDQLVRAHVGAIADRDEPGELESAREPAPDDVGAEPAALRDDADRADFFGAALGEPHPPARRIDAEAVRSDQARVAVARRGDELVLELAPLFHL